MNLNYVLIRLIWDFGFNVEELSKISEARRETVTKWIRGETFPHAYHVLKLAMTIPESEFELLNSLMYNQFLYRKDNAHVSRLDHIFIFEEELIRFTKSGAWWAKSPRMKDYNADLLGYVSTLSKRVSEFKKALKKDNKTAKSEILLMPKPPLIVLNNWRNVIKEIIKKGDLIYSMKWDEFEDFIGHLLAEFGWEIEPQGRTKDDGIDLIATRLSAPDIEFRMMVQCKKYSSHRKVGLSVIKEVWATKWKHGFHHALIATSSSFTKGAKNEAESLNLELRDFQSIIEWCKEYAKISSSS